MTLSYKAGDFSVLAHFITLGRIKMMLHVVEKEEKCMIFFFSFSVSSTSFGLQD